MFFGWVLFLISSGSPHVRCTPMGRTCGEPNEIELPAAHGLSYRSPFRYPSARYGFTISATVNTAGLGQHGGHGRINGATDTGAGVDADPDGGVGVEREGVAEEPLFVSEPRGRGGGSVSLAMAPNGTLTLTMTDTAGKRAATHSKVLVRFLISLARLHVHLRPTAVYRTCEWANEIDSTAARSLYHRTGLSP